MYTIYCIAYLFLHSPLYKLKYTYSIFKIHIGYKHTIEPYRFISISMKYTHI